jgi:DNA-directed RNA polymerase subunit RPC12/RpoP
MHERGTRQYILALAGGVAAALVVFGTLGVLGGSASLDGCAAAFGIWWIVPLLAGVVIGGVLWFLGAQRPKDTDETVAEAGAVCPDCGGAVMTEWRLCPSCGGKLRIEERGPVRGPVPGRQSQA